MAARREIRYHLGLNQRISCLSTRNRLQMRRLQLSCGVLLVISEHEADDELNAVTEKPSSGLPAPGVSHYFVSVPRWVQGVNWKVHPQFLQILNRDEIGGIFRGNVTKEPATEFPDCKHPTVLFILLPLENPLNPMKSFVLPINVTTVLKFVEFVFNGRRRVCKKMFTVPPEPLTSEVMRFAHHPAPPETMGLCSSYFLGLCFNQDEENGQRKTVGVMLGSQSKTIHFIRHAEGTHNEAAAEFGRGVYINEEYADARLTEVGKEQCAKLKADHTGLKQTELVVISPLSRAIQTALLSIEQVEGVPWIVLECARERSGKHPCDRRRPVHELKVDFPTIIFDNIDEGEDKLHDANERESEESVMKRAKELLDWLGGRTETNIVVVTHSVLLMCFFNEVLVAPANLAKRFENCELRTLNMEF